MQTKGRSRRMEEVIDNTDTPVDTFLTWSLGLGNDFRVSQRLRCGLRRLRMGLGYSFIRAFGILYGECGAASPGPLLRYPPSRRRPYCPNWEKPTIFPSQPSGHCQNYREL